MVGHVAESPKGINLIHIDLSELTGVLKKNKLHKFKILHIFATNRCAYEYG